MRKLVLGFLFVSLHYTGYASSVTLQGLHFVCDLKKSGIFIVADVLSYTLPCPETFMITTTGDKFQW